MRNLTYVMAFMLGLFCMPVNASPSAADPAVAECTRAADVVAAAAAKGVKTVVLEGKVAADFMAKVFQEHAPAPSEYVNAVNDAGDALVVVVQEPEGAAAAGAELVLGAMFGADGCDLELGVRLEVSKAKEFLGSGA
jgi:hypothetical protein